MIGLLWLFACGPTSAPERAAEKAAEKAAADAAPKETANRLYRLQWKTVPAPIPLSQLFELEVTITDRDGKPVEGATLSVDATMPQHGHGMATRPQVDPGECAADGTCRHPGGVYRVQGMKFHMQGDWLLRFAVSGPAGSDHLDVPHRL